MKKLYITTAIDYANGDPHIGHIYEKILADTVARVMRVQGHDVQFMTGLDEHGQKVSQSAKKNGISEKEQCDKIAENFKHACDVFDISYDRYIRTTDEDHVTVVQKCLQKLFDDGEIYKKSYTGLYSKTAERFVLEKDKVDGKWPTDFGEVVELSETNYFFKLAKHREWLIDYINTHPDFIFPKFRTKQLLEFLSEPINDLCISRPKNRLSWGIELPFDSEYVTYVWFDALLNYVTGANFLTEQFNEYWPADIHVIGKDILVPAHSVYWPIMLHALGLEMPKKFLVHGWWLVFGEKMSKSIGNVVDPLNLASKFGADPVRYHLMREMTVGQDCDFSAKRFIARYNSDLANDLGNLVNRLLNMANRYCSGMISEVTVNEQQEQALKKLIGDSIDEIVEHCNNFAFNQALDKLFSCISSINVYIENRAPWKLSKSENPKDHKIVKSSLSLSVECLCVLIKLLYPIMPSTSKKILNLFGSDEDIKWDADLSNFSRLAGEKLSEKAILFPKFDIDA